MLAVHVHEPLTYKWVGGVPTGQNCPTQVAQLFARLHVGFPEQVLGWFPLRLGLVTEDKPAVLSCKCIILSLCDRDAI